MNKQDQQKEVDKNYSEFKKLMPKIIFENQGKYALMNNGKIINFFTKYEDAEKAGALLKGKLFSIQKVDASIIDLGYFSYV